MFLNSTQGSRQPVSTKYSSRRDGKEMRAAPQLQQGAGDEGVGRVRGKDGWRKRLSVLVRCCFYLKETCFTMYLLLKNIEKLINTCIVFKILSFKTSL